MIRDPHLKKLLTRYQQVAQKMAAERGPLALFGLFERDDDPNRLDLVIAASWLHNGLSDYKEVGKYLPHLTLEEAALLGRIVILQPDDEFVQDVNRAIETEGEVKETGRLTAWEVDIVRSYIIISHKTPVSVSQNDKLALAGR